MLVIFVRFCFFEPVFRRVSLMNVSAMSVVIDEVVFNDYVYADTYRYLKEFVFHRIYDYLLGGAPVLLLFLAFIVSHYFLVVYLFFNFSIYIFCP